MFALLRLRMGRSALLPAISRRPGALRATTGPGRRARGQRDVPLPEKEEQELLGQQRRLLLQALTAGNLEYARSVLKQPGALRRFARGLQKEIREKKHRLRPVLGPRDFRGGRGRRQAKAQVVEEDTSSIKVNWVVHVPSQLVEESEPSEESAMASLREISLKLEGLVPAGCLITVNLHGRETALKPEIMSRHGEVRPAPSRSETTYPLRRSEESEPEITGYARMSSLQGASFDPSIFLDCCALIARTEQRLLVPSIDLIEVHDTTVVLSLRNLSGERFELTVYASGCAPSAASTLVQRGPVRGSESVHRIGPLEASQVYVAWVKVFSDTKSAESKQKGFKTLEAKEKTIWDEKDHIILGVAEDATSKEIVKAWRSKSLQYHPDKVPDEKKEEAEEMMKRLNLAKVNMTKRRPQQTERGILTSR
ncbi:unnamed protein product [Effrenium voratum]|nr:unnamed protein product [Effrenium voratum]